MKIKTIPVKAENCNVQSINIGHRDEGKIGDRPASLRIIFDCSELAKVYGDGACEILHVRAGDDENEMYPVLIAQEGTDVIWDVSASDTHKAGQGKLELRWYVGQSLSKHHFKTLVSNAIKGDMEPPEAYQPWVNDVLAAGLSAKESEINAAESAKKAEQGAVNAGFMEFDIDEDGHLIETKYNMNDISFVIENERLVIEIE